jgi:hypothetical protein
MSQVSATLHCYCTISTLGSRQFCVTMVTHKFIGSLVVVICDKHRLGSKLGANFHFRLDFLVGSHKIGSLGWKLA